MEITPVKINNSKNQLKNNYVTVSCRLKPLTQNQEMSIVEVNKFDHTITISKPSKGTSMTYEFDEIFEEHICQK